MSKRISELNATTDLTQSDEFAVVQSNETKKITFHNLQKEIINYLVPYSLTVVPSVNDDLGRSIFADAEMIKLTWSGVNGSMILTLPDCTDANNINRVIRLISDSSFATNTRVYVTPASGQNLDGSSSNYEINKAYEGVAIWSDGSEWFIIQKKAS